jgi:hypothetical protein
MEEEWNIGIMERWNIGTAHDLPIIPTFQHSIIPVQDSSPEVR